MVSDSFAFALIDLVWLCIEGFDKVNGERISYAFRHRDDDQVEFDYRTGQRMVVVTEDEIYNPRPANVAKAREIIEHHRYHVMELLFPGQDPSRHVKRLGRRLAKYVEAIAMPIFDEARRGTTWDESVLQHYRYLIPKVTEACLRATANLPSWRVGNLGCEEESRANT